MALFCPPTFPTRRQSGLPPSVNTVMVLSALQSAQIRVDSETLPPCVLQPRSQVWNQSVIIVIVIIISSSSSSSSKAGNSCYYSVQALLSSRLLSKNLKIKIYQTIILPVVLYGCET